MRRARGLKVSTSRDICIFCATRQITSRNPLSTSQRRQLTSSSHASQSTEGVIHKDEGVRRSNTSQAAQMRELLAAMSQATPPAKPAPRTRSVFAPPTPSSPYRQRQALPERWTTNPSNNSGGFGRNTTVSTFPPAPSRREPRRIPVFDKTPQDKFVVEFGSRPSIKMPAFATGQLKRRTEEEPQPAPPALISATPPPVQRPLPQRKKLNDEEMFKLLNSSEDSNRRTREQPSFSKPATALQKCLHCGSSEHATSTCPQEPVLRQSTLWSQSAIPLGPRATTTYQPSKFQSAGTNKQVEESVADAAESWILRKKIAQDEPKTQAQLVEERTRSSTEGDRRRKRFDFGESHEVKNRYEEPDRRRSDVRSHRTSQYEEEEEKERPRTSKQERKKQRAKAKKAAALERADPVPISLPEYVSVANLAGILRLRVEDFVQKLEELGFEDVQNDHILNAEHAGLIAQEYNFEPIFQSEAADGDLYPAPTLEAEVYAELPARPPVVTIMGHVDHGKTTILDYMRSTSVVASEFGGITQHIGAFSVPLANGKKITFLDTPGHAAFETMRARGANVTDIVVLVVAADDSVMPQTIEAIKHAQAAKVPMIVAINKIDKSQADPDAVKTDLGRYGIEIEDVGGEVQTICISGKTGQGIPDLEEAISTLSEMLDHRADPEATVEGWVLEGTTKKSGRVATVLVRSGTLRPGTVLVAGTTWTRVRSLRNEAGTILKEVGPGMAVEVDGWRDQPIAGDEVLQADDEQHAGSVSELRTQKVEREQMARDMEAVNEARRQEAERREAEAAASQAAANDEAPAERKEENTSGPEVVSFIIKGDVSGSVEAVIDSVSAIGNAEVSTRILRHGVGPPSEFDILHAADASGHVVNFNTVIPAHVSKLAGDKGVRILDSNIIYRVVENVKDLLSEKLKPRVVQKVTGEAEIAVIFEIGIGGRKKMKVAGSKVRNGMVDRGSRVRVLRGDGCVHTGTIASIKNQKKDVEQMRKDTECGIAFEGWSEFKVGDKIQCFEEKFEKRSL